MDLSPIAGRIRDDYVVIFVDADDVAALTETLVHPIRPSAVAVLYGVEGPTQLEPEGV